MKHRSAGFTIMELLIVIVIIGILAAVIIPNLLGARTAAANTGARSFLRNVLTSAEMDKAEGATLPTTATTCSAVLTQMPLEHGITDCKLKSDGVSVFILAQAANGTYFYWDGLTTTGPLDAAPANF